MWLLHAGTVAAEQEDPDASYKLAYMYKVGRGGLQQDDAAAVSLERVSAGQVFLISAFLLRGTGACSH
jgi:TPR repeat protein